MAIAYHFFNDPDNQPYVWEGIRRTYDGPLALAKDMMIWNVTAESIRHRMIIFDEDQWPPPLAQQAARGRTNETYGTEYSPEL